MRNNFLVAYKYHTNFGNYIDTFHYKCDNYPFERDLKDKIKELVPAQSSGIQILAISKMTPPQYKFYTGKITVIDQSNVGN